MAEELAEILLETYNSTEFSNSQYRIIINSHINSIDDIPCNAVFKMGRDGIYFIVESNIVCNNNIEYIELYFSCNSLNTDMIKEQLLIFSRNIMSALPKLKLSINGRLTIDNNDKCSMKMLDIFSKINNLKVDEIRECCVCYQHTHTKTPCNHSLCYRCWFKLPHIGEDDDDEDFEIPCPICRENIRFI